MRQPGLSPYAIEVEAFVRLAPRIVTVQLSKLGVEEAASGDGGAVKMRQRSSTEVIAGKRPETATIIAGAQASLRL